MFFILLFFVGYILSFALVRLRTIRLSAREGAHIECRCSRSRAEDVTITNVIIKKTQIGLGWEWRHAWKQGDGNFGDFWKKKQLVEIRTWARPVHLWSTGCAAHLLDQWVEIWLWAESSAGELTEERCRNSQHSKNCISLSSCQKTKSQKVNKRFVPELKKVVSVSGFLCMWTFYVSVYLYSCICITAMQQPGSTKSSP